MLQNEHVLKMINFKLEHYRVYQLPETLKENDNINHFLSNITNKFKQKLTNTS